MRVLPIVERELRVTARRRGTYWMRLLVGASAFLVFAFMLWFLTIENVPTAQRGRMLFSSVVGVLGIFCLLAGAFATSDCIAKEKREGTLGLLFLTDLKGYDVALGKLVANSLDYVYGLMVVIPVLALSLQLGGVTFFQVSDAALALLVTLFFSLSMGLLISVLSLHERRAMFGTIGLVGALVFLPLLGVDLVLGAISGQGYWAAFVEVLLPGVEVGELVASCSPGAPVLLAIHGGRPPALLHFSLLVSFLYSVVAIRIASRRITTAWQEGGRHGMMQRLTQWCSRWGRSWRNRSSEVRLLDRYPYAWLTLKGAGKQAKVWAYVISMVVIWVSSSIFDATVMLELFLVVMSITVVHFFLKVWVASEAAMRIVEDRQSGTLELILTTPLSSAGIVRGSWVAFLKQFGSPVAVLALLEFGVVWKAISLSGAMAVTLILVLDLVALHWVAMSLGLRKGRTNGAIVGAINRILTLRTVLLVVAYVVLIGFGGLNRYFGMEDEDLFDFCFTSWVVLGILIDVSLGLVMAQESLRLDFRKLATGELAGKEHKW